MVVIMNHCYFRNNYSIIKSIKVYLFINFVQNGDFQGMPCRAKSLDFENILNNFKITCNNLQCSLIKRKKEKKEFTIKKLIFLQLDF